ncbi:hypothetical protein DEO72_LG2g4109 [Vigna unguiculata]|uniref:Uncharacterized protein n=1 Tax=Vigna unguiculata TaxID=3917 RepID=A0A4D6L5F3_VIGUN|nr:hypothetical protein DEO72_LG2g4109 [Vigna unguiculata]
MSSQKKSIQNVLAPTTRPPPKSKPPTTGTKLPTVQQRFYHRTWDQNISTHRGADNGVIGPLSPSLGRISSFPLDLDWGLSLECSITFEFDAMLGLVAAVSFPIWWTSAARLSETIFVQQWIEFGWAATSFKIMLCIPWGYMSQMTYIFQNSWLNSLQPREDDVIQDNVIPSHCWKVVARLAVMIQCPTGTVPGDMFLGPGYVAFGNTWREPTFILKHSSGMCGKEVTTYLARDTSGIALIIFQVRGVYKIHSSLILEKHRNSKWSGNTSLS